MSVYVVQKQHRWDAQKQELVQKYDLEPAEEYGDLVYLLSPTAAPFNSKPIVEELKESLYGFSDDDYLLLIGNPALIGFAVAIAADNNQGNLKLLQWSGKDKKYLPIKVNGLFTYDDGK